MHTATAASPLSLCDCAVGVQALSLKEQLRADFSGTLNQLAAMGYRDFEMCSFKGFAGDKLRGDFGDLADLDHTQIRRMISASGMSVRSCQFKPFELEDTNIENTLELADALGLKYIVLVDVYFANQEWQQTFDSLNAFGQKARTAGFRLGLHTPNDFWIQRDGQTAFHAMLAEVPGENCSIELDLSASLLSGVDPGDCLASHPGHFFALHLRDGKKPTNPVPYLPALPLGQGEIDFKRALAGAQTGGVTNYIVEMVVMPPNDPIHAYHESAAFIRTLGE